MKTRSDQKFKFFILTAIFLLLTSFTLPAANRDTCPTFGSRSLDTISQTASITKSHQQIYVTFHYEITLIYIPTHHSSQCRMHDITHHGPQGQTYDPLNRPASTSVDSASASETQAFTYDPDGNLTQTVTDGSTSAMSYDAFGRLSSRTFETGKTVSYSYYPNGQLHTITDNLGSTIGYQYNKSGLLDSVKDGNNHTLAAYTYTDEGQIDTITQPGATTTFSYDNAGRILTETAKDTNNAVIVQDSFIYDDAGNITHKTETRSDKTWDIDYTYTTDNRLKGYTITDSQVTNHESQVTVVEYDYDSAGNRTSSRITDHESQITVVTYTYNDFNQLTASTTKHPDGTETVTTYQYDQGGRLTSSQITNHESQVTAVEYGYNGFGYMVSARTQTPQTTSEATYTYSYDGKRISKYIDGTLYDYTYTGSNLLETYADTAGRIAKYSYGNALISQTNATGSSEPVVTDYQNSVCASVSASDGALTLFAYDPFGKVRYQSNSDITPGLGWLSRQFDKETGNNYLINRYYNADTARFLSPDQYQYVDPAIPFTWNLYQYAFANPLVNVDPEGNMSPGMESQANRKLLMSMTDEQRDQFIHDDLEIQKGMLFDAPPEFVMGMITGIPAILKMVALELSSKIQHLSSNTRRKAP
ncbi:MAG: RHS repeat-associated core domain-containing protein [Acidobacteria bacterium]|nr:RHS repeat-associated core domain-containing protein [Acidobacteriota bacterium]